MTKRRLGILVAILLILLLTTIAYHRFRVQTKRLLYSTLPLSTWIAVDQPIRFNHLHHREVAKLNCTFCHRFAERERIAGIPNIEICRACHSTDAVSKRPEALKVVEYVKQGKRIPWIRMYELPPFVVFPHWIHVQSGIDCSICHGLTGAKERPVKMVDRNYMEWCLDCHRKRGASDDCYACHSS
jgi:c(7)-type cytochrome triheme protein